MDNIACELCECGFSMRSMADILLDGMGKIGVRTCSLVDLLSDGMDNVESCRSRSATNVWSLIDTLFGPLDTAALCKSGSPPPP
ncbi:hypothetical protein BS47DRAFT_275092 [Hydnum rufescens UP504]|uniref:Uncharacterized protein n=1 Tax=Hydnum rufescens UP504 TaxID=1448309 RepID=A0A9P6AL95_9AGAM|nr:hypothetical protein BS47DRAFT_275092 [Hydnum rufescens UP504]